MGEILSSCPWRLSSADVFSDLSSLSSLVTSTMPEGDEFDEYLNEAYPGETVSNFQTKFAGSNKALIEYVFVINSSINVIDPYGLEHRKKTPCKWDKHSKPRPGRCEKKKMKPGWKPRNPSKDIQKACIAGVVVIITVIVWCDPIPGDELVWASCCAVAGGSVATSEPCCCPGGDSGGGP